MKKARVTIDTEGVGMPSNDTYIAPVHIKAVQEHNKKLEEKREAEEKEVEELIVKMEKMMETDEFELWCTPLDGEGISLLVSLLEVHPTLRTLSLCSCGIGVDSGVELAKLVGKLPNLLVLDLYGNPIGNDSVIELSQQVEDVKLVKLRAIILGEDRITDVGAAALARIIKRAPDLQYLVLAGNRITEKGAEEILSALREVKYNSLLEKVDLSGNQISRSILKEIRDILNEIQSRRIERIKEADEDTKKDTEHMAKWLGKPLEESYPQHLVEKIERATSDGIPHEHHHEHDDW